MTGNAEPYGVECCVDTAILQSRGMGSLHVLTSTQFTHEEVGADSQGYCAVRQVASGPPAVPWSCHCLGIQLSWEPGTCWYRVNYVGVAQPPKRHPRIGFIHLRLVWMRHLRCVTSAVIRRLMMWEIDLAHGNISHYRNRFSAPEAQSGKPGHRSVFHYESHTYSLYETSKIQGS